MILVYRRTSMATVKTIGRSGQIVLGKEYAGRSVLVDQVEPGVWIIKVGEFVPDSERWLYEAQVQQEVEEAIAWAERNPAASYGHQGPDGTPHAMSDPAESVQLDLNNPVFQRQALGDLNALR